MSDGWPGSFDEDGKYFGFDNANADSFFGTTDWNGRHQIYTSEGREGEIVVWKNNANCQMSCGRWNDNGGVSSAQGGDWTEGMSIYLSNDILRKKLQFNHNEIGNNKLGFKLGNCLGQHQDLKKVA